MAPIPPLGVAAKIDQLRRNHPTAITQNDLAAQAGIAQSTFSRRTRRNDWTLPELRAIAEVLEVRPHDLLDEGAA